MLFINNPQTRQGYNPTSVEFLKSLAGKLVTAIAALLVIGGAVWWWQLPPEQRSAIVGGAGAVAGWTVAVIVLPWISFGLISRVGRLSNNTASAALVAGYTLLDALLMAWLMNWQIGGHRLAAIVGVLMAAAYNLLACDWIAERFE